jgi:tetratricopeptide (TPR) repeat protein
VLPRSVARMAVLQRRRGCRVMLDVVSIVTLVLLPTVSTGRRGAVLSAPPPSLPPMTTPATAAEAEAMIRSAMAAPQENDLLAQARLYQEVVRHVRGLAGYEALLEILGAAAKLWRSVKQHDAALQCHQEMLSLRGKAGAIPESYLVLWTEIATDLHLGAKYAEALRVLDQAEAQLSGALQDEGLALLYKQRAFLHDCSGEYQQAVEQMKLARSMAAAPDLATELDDLLRHRTMLTRMVAARRLESISTHGGEPAATSPIQEEIDSMGKLLVQRGQWSSAQQLPHKFFSELTARPWHSTDDLPQLQPLVDVLRDAAPLLRKEYRKLKRKGLLVTDEDCIQHSAGGKWHRYEIAAIWQRLNGTTCSMDSPVACSVLSKLRHTGVVPIHRAGYSAVDAQTWIRPHFGSSNAALKLHLGLRVDRSGCAKMRVGTEWRGWTEGEVVLFDDSFEHEVWNSCSSERIVFQVVIRHPDLRWEDPRTYTPVIVDAH